MDRSVFAKVWPKTSCLIISMVSGSTPSTKTLTDLLNAGDFSSIEVEFERAIKHLDQDPHASITASSSIIEALCKTYIETFGLNMPTKQTIKPLWGVVLKNLGLNSNSTLRDDQIRTLQGLSSIVDGVGAYRTHIGSAHGRGISPPKISVAEARLAVNAAHSLVIFVMELWHLKELNKALQVTANPLAPVNSPIRRCTSPFCSRRVALSKINYWHMQMHPDDKSFADEHIYSVLEQKRIIGLGTWDDGEATIETFRNQMQVNDVVAIKNGGRLIALV